MSSRIPTGDACIAHRPADFSTIAESLDYAAKGEGGANFYSPRGELEHVLRYRDLREQAISLARRMVRAGLARGERVGLVAQTNPDFLRAFFACQYAGLVPVPLPVPMAFGRRGGYVEQIQHMVKAAGAAALLCPEDWRAMLDETAQTLVPKAIGDYRLFDALPEDHGDLPPADPDRLAYLQFSSGSTRAPTGVAVTQRAVLANLHGISCHGLCLTERDRYNSWLPFYHDMGLVGFVLAPLANQGSVDYLAPQDFARRPLLWPELIARNRATVSYSPNFGYELCTRRAAAHSGAARGDLSSWRAAGIGGDMIRPAVLSRFVDTFAGWGFQASAFVASYGMAEATLAACFAPLGQGLKTDRIDLSALETENRALPATAQTVRAREFALCGRVLPDHALEIRDQSRANLRERGVGRIFIRGSSLMREYFGLREETARVLSSDGWLDTGDLGYRIGDQFVVTGRSKDLLLVNGRNLWPQDLEWAVERELAAVRSGEVAAISVDDGVAESVVLLVECHSSHAAVREELRRTVAEVVVANAGINCTVALMPPKSLPRTSSGKLSRTHARAMYLTFQQRQSVENGQAGIASHKSEFPASHERPMPDARQKNGRGTIYD